MLFLLLRKFEGVESLSEDSALFSEQEMGSKLFSTWDRKWVTSVSFWIFLQMWEIKYDIYHKQTPSPSRPSSQLVCCRAAQLLRCCCFLRHWCCCRRCYPAGGRWWRLLACDWPPPALPCLGAVRWDSTSVVCPTAETPGAAPEIWKQKQVTSTHCHHSPQHQGLWVPVCFKFRVLIIDTPVYLITTCESQSYLWVSIMSLENSSLSNSRSWIAPCASLVCLCRAALAFVSSSAMTLRRQQKFKSLFSKTQIIYIHTYIF